MERCPGCHAAFADDDGPVHAYMTSSAGCWRRYGEVLAREYANPALFAAAHRLTVDAYALQHPGDPDERRARQSVWLHYTSLRLIFEHDATHAEATRALQTLSDHRFGDRPEAPDRYAVTVDDLARAGDQDHAQIALRWARCAYDAWHALGDEADKLVARCR